MSELAQQKFDLAQIAAVRLRQIEERLGCVEQPTSLPGWAALKAALPSEPSEIELREAYSQSVACGGAALAYLQATLDDKPLLDRMLSYLGPLWRELLEAQPDECQPPRNEGRGECGADQHDDPLLYFYEEFLRRRDATNRKRQGVYYTPQPVVSFIVESLDELLREEYSLEWGLADTATWSQMSGSRTMGAKENWASSPFVHILDPALGSGAFLVEVVERIYRTLSARWLDSGDSPADIADRWNEYVPRHLLPRIVGLELAAAPCLIAQLKLLAKLAETGYRFETPGTLSIFMADTLAAPDNISLLDKCPFTVVLGNPPFSAISHNRSRWIDRLLKGRLPDGGQTANYYQVDGQPLGERKLWLQDDYVKFIRYAQWQIELADCGLIGMVTNHGYVDNASFRGMRRELMCWFDHVSVVDLHGNQKKKERPPDGGIDENVFKIEQGVAVGLFRRLAEPSESGEVRHADLWGSQEEKSRRLSASSIFSFAAKQITPTAPHYFFTPRDAKLQKEYQRGWKLTDIMPVRSTASVTARDGFVLAHSKEELQQRLEAFADLSIADEEIRQRYFTNGRSDRYPPGDTRGWKLAEARQRLAAIEDWSEYFRVCQYRPFDRRTIFWADWMIDWPRTETTPNMLAGENIALVARRRMLPSQACNYFWISETVVLDGLIRSDNRGSESLFPLYLYEESAKQKIRRANFDGGFLDQVKATLSLDYLADGGGDLSITFGPEDLAYMIYATFYSTGYRRLYAEELRIDFPRIFLPKKTQLFGKLARAGHQLARLHMDKVDSEFDARDKFGVCGLDATVAPGFPKYADGNIFLNRDFSVTGVADNLWHFRVGGYQPCQKWLKERRGRTLSEEQIRNYQKLLFALDRTTELMEEIDREIDSFGGWPKAFVGRDEAITSWTG